VNLGECQGKIRHPLQRLRVYIRVYIAAECVALVLLFLAAWFWIGLLFDYGLFALTRAVLTRGFAPSTAPLDWKEILPRAYPVLLFLLVGTLLGILAYHIFRRLIREFRDKALALLMERRFPKLLGDRLITAVELADVRAAARYGYSRPMIEQTIRDAAERVDQVPIRQVFNWKRLVWMYGLVVFMYVGMTILFAGGFMLFTSSGDPHGKLAGGWRSFTNVQSAWISRSFGLNDTYWDRDAYLEVQGYPRYRLTQSSLDALTDKDGLPRDVAGKLAPLMDRYRLTKDDLVMLTERKIVPPGVARKLAPLVDEKEMPEKDFQKAVEEKLTSSESENYRQAIVNSARIKSNRLPTEEFLDALASSLSEQEYRKYEEAILRRAEKTDVRVGRDRGIAEVRVRAYKWVIATDDPGRGRYGWRPMKWSDVTPELVGTTEQLPALPASWLVREEYLALLAGPKDGLAITSLPYAAIVLSQQAAAEPWTVDRVEQRLGPDGLDVDALVKIRKFLGEKEKLLQSKSITMRQREAAPGGARAGERFVIKDESGEWRTLLWTDLDSAAEPLGLEVPALPKQWPEDITLDEVADRIAGLEIDRLLEIKTQVLARLENVAEQTGPGRKVRALKIPTGKNAVTVYYTSADTRTQNTASLTPQANNEFAVTLDDLRDNVHCTIRAEDYFTPPLQIEVMAEPRLTSFTYDRYIPAYILYRMPGRDQMALKGKRQFFEGAALSAEAGEVNNIQVPAGTRVTLKGTATSPLRSPPTIVSDAGQFYALPAVATLDPKDPASFEVEIGDLEVREYIQDSKLQRQDKYEFHLELTDQDGVKNTYQMKIAVVEDHNPSVSVKVVDYLREVKKDNDYRGHEGSKIITVDAWVPFVGEIKDDHGLAHVDFVFTVAPVEARTDTILQALLAARGIGQLGSGTGGALRSIPYMWMAFAPKTGKGLKDVTEHRMELPHFETARRPGIRPELGELGALLDMRFDDVLRRKLALKTDESVPDLVGTADLYQLEPEPSATDRPKTGLDLKTLQEKMKDARGQPLLRKASDRDIQTRYKIQVEVEAQDTDIENGPHKALNKEAFSFLVVSEQELLGLVARDEEELHLELKKGLDELNDCERLTTRALNEDIRAPKGLEEFRKISDRLIKVDEGLERSKVSVLKVADDMERVLNELQANRVSANPIDHAEKVVQPLRAVLKKDYDDVRQAMSELHSVLEDKADDKLPSRTKRSVAAAEEARTKIIELTRKIDAVSQLMEGITSFNKLIDTLRQIQERSGDIAQRLDGLYKQLIDQLFRPENPK
jgi:hypothetical protein